MSLLSKRRQVIIFNSPNSQQKTSIRQNITRYNLSHNVRGGRVVTGLFELDLLNHERQLKIFSYLY